MIFSRIFMQYLTFEMICETCGLEELFVDKKPSQCPSCGSSSFKEAPSLHDRKYKNEAIKPITGTLDEQIAEVNQRLEKGGFSNTAFLKLVEKGSKLVERRNMRDHEHPARAIFDLSQRAIPFSEDVSKHIPEQGSLIYTIWDVEDNLLYVGVAGTQKEMARRNPLPRMLSHASGKRNGDQFCMSIHDFFVVPELLVSGGYDPSRDKLDELTREFIHQHLFYRFAVFNDEVSHIVVRKLQSQIRRGAFGFLVPQLNGIKKKY